jgi:hypothetical protein
MTSSHWTLKHVLTAITHVPANPNHPEYWSVEPFMGANGDIINYLYKLWPPHPKRKRLLVMRLTRDRRGRCLIPPELLPRLRAADPYRSIWLYDFQKDIACHLHDEYEVKILSPQLHQIIFPWERSQTSLPLEETSTISPVPST